MPLCSIGGWDGNGTLGGGVWISITSLLQPPPSSSSLDSSLLLNRLLGKRRARIQVHSAHHTCTNTHKLTTLSARPLPSPLLPPKSLPQPFESLPILDISRDGFLSSQASTSSLFSSNQFLRSLLDSPLTTRLSFCICCHSLTLPLLPNKRLLSFIPANCVCLPSWNRLPRVSPT